MPISLINPDSLPVSDLYHHGCVATGSQFVYVAGQVGWDASGAVTSSDLADQVECCFLNVATVLAAAGASLADVARFTAYFVDWSPDKTEAYRQGLVRAARRLGVDVPTPPLTGIGVAALAEPGILVEIEAVAVLTERAEVGRPS